MLIYNGQIIAGGGTIVLPMTRAEYEANKAILDSADVWVDLTDEPDQVATADQIAYSVDGVQKGMGYIGDIATKAIAKVEPTDTALYLHEVGEYFINKDGDACKVDLQIPVDGTITLGTNCHVLPKGVANDINSNLSSAVLFSGLADNDDNTVVYNLSEAYTNFNYVLVQGLTNVEKFYLLIPTSNINSADWNHMCGFACETHGLVTNIMQYAATTSIKFTTPTTFKMWRRYTNINWNIVITNIIGIGKK